MGKLNVSDQLWGTIGFLGKEKNFCNTRREIHCKERRKKQEARSKKEERRKKREERRKKKEERRKKQERRKKESHFSDE